MLRTIGEWPIASEEVSNETLRYLIGGEALDWRLLARRVIEGVSNPPPKEEWQSWLDIADLFGGFEEPEFMRLLGVDKSRAALSFFYGVTVEQALIATAREEITKRRVASGREASDDRCDEAYTRLYGDFPDRLWQDFCRENPAAISEAAQAKRGEKTLGDDDAFTYWLFKRRMERADPARVASDTRKGLGQLEKMRRSHDRRLRMLRLSQVR